MELVDKSRGVAEDEAGVLLSRKRTPNLRKWLEVSKFGQTRVLEADKYVLMQKSGLNTRDLRALDPLLGYPSSIFGRERAMVVSLEQIRAIITTEEVLLQNFTDPTVAPLAELLQRRLSLVEQPVHSEVGTPQPNGLLAISFSAPDLQAAQGVSPDKGKAGPSTKPKEEPAGGRSSLPPSVDSSRGRSWSPARPKEEAARKHLEAFLERRSPLGKPPGPPVVPPETLPGRGRKIDRPSDEERILERQQNASPFRRFLRKGKLKGFTKGGNSPDLLARGGLMGENGHFQLLPFELRALEVMLELVCAQLDKAALEMEREAYPMLDDLAAAVSSVKLERVKILKSRLVLLTLRVQRVHDEIENLLDDDDDMYALYLTEKMHRAEEAAAKQATPLFLEDPPSTSQQGQEPTVPPRPSDPPLEPELATVHEEEISGSNPVAATDTLAAFTGHDRHSRPRRRSGKGQRARSRSSSRSSSGSSRTRSSRSSKSSLGGTHNVQEVEMLLEAYFSQLKGIANRLSVLREYIDDTEDYISIRLDDHQNQLWNLTVIVNIGAFVLSIPLVVTSYFGMNIPCAFYKSRQDDPTIGPDYSAWVSSLMLVASVTTAALIFGWLHLKNLIFW